MGYDIKKREEGYNHGSQNGMGGLHNTTGATSRLALAIRWRQQVSSETFVPYQHTLHGVTARRPLY